VLPFVRDHRLPFDINSSSGICGYQAVADGFPAGAPGKHEADQSASRAILLWVSSRSRRRHHYRPTASLPKPEPATSAPSSPHEAERLLLVQIASGDLDAHLVSIAEAVRARHELLHTINSQTALGQLCVGDKVRINHHASPRYLHGIQGTIVELDHYAAVVCVHHPIGRFKNGEIRCPPLVLDRLTPAA
jgi:hypothetical protein